MWLEFMKTKKLTVNKWELIKEGDLITTDSGLVNAAFIDPLDKTCMKRYRINLLDTFEQHSSKYKCNGTRILCKKTEC